MKNKLISKNINKKRGFTLVEVMIVIPILILTIGVFISTIITTTGDVIAVRNTNALTFDVQDALNRIEQDVKLSGGYLATNNITPLTSPQGYDDVTADFDNVSGSSEPALILNTYATTDNPIRNNNSLVYMKDLPNACGGENVIENSTLMMNVVYFVKNETLWRRVIAPSNYANTGIVCVVPWQKPSCSPGYSATFCKSEDVKLVEGIKNGGFSISYFTTPSSSTNNPIATDSSKTDSIRQATLRTTSTISVTIAAEKTIAGRDISQSGTIRASSRNNNIDAN